jgi:hypothetical protein
MDTLTTEIIETAVQTGAIIKNGDIINGVPNSALTFLLTSLAGFFIRIIEKRRLRKAGKLHDINLTKIDE